MYYYNDVSLVFVVFTSSRVPGWNVTGVTCAIDVVWLFLPKTVNVLWQFRRLVPTMLRI